MIYLVFLAALLPFALILYGRLISPLKLQRRWRFFWGSVIVTLTAIVAYALPLTLQMARHPAAYADSIWMTLLPWMYYAMTLLFVIIMLIVIRDLVWLLAKVVHVVREYRQNAAMKKSGRTELTPEEIEASNVRMSRRTFLKKASTLAVVGGAVVATPVSIYAAKHDRKIKEVEIALEQLPKELEGLRIVHLSDIHVGNTMFKEDVAAIVAETNALNPDLIAITGDMVDGIPSTIGDWLEPLRELKARYGVWFVTGNHDHMWDGRAWCDFIANLGIHVLENAHEIVKINGIQMAIAGVIDYRGDRKNRRWKTDPVAALSGIPQKMFKLMLVHQPASVDDSLANGADLVLVGHTHGGQCWPINYIVDAMMKYSRGLYMVDGKAVFVSCGTGYWGPPLRIGFPPEIDVITLKKA